MNFKLIRKAYRILDSGQRKNAFLLVFLCIIGALLETLGIGLIIPLVTLLVRGGLQGHGQFLDFFLEKVGNPPQDKLILIVVLGFVGIYTVKIAFLTFLGWWQLRFNFRLQSDLARKLFVLYLRLPYTFHLQHNSTTLIQNITGESGVFANGVVNSSIQIFCECLIIAGLFSVLVYFEPLGTLLTLIIFGGGGYVLFWGTKKKTKDWGKQRLFHERQSSKQLYQSFGGVKDVKILGREQEFINQFQGHYVQSKYISQLSAFIQQLPRLWIELLAVLTFAIMLITMTQRGTQPSDIVPVMGIFAAVAFRLMPSISRIISALQTLRFSQHTIDVVYDQLQLESETTPLGRPGSQECFLDAISVRNLVFSYTAAPTLNNISLTIKKGESIGIIGPSGSGKSTLIDIILGILSPQTGAIEVDGKNVQLNIRKWQNQIGYVPQSIFLTDDTLLKNVAFGVPENEIDVTAVWDAIRASQLEVFVNELPEGIQTIVGERGVRLSGGQRQRIGIARALYHGPSVLVLDEATSALDETTEENVMKSVERLRNDKTIIIVSHRLHTVSKCDRVYCLSKGQITHVESNPMVLLKREGQSSQDFKR